MLTVEDHEYANDPFFWFYRHEYHALRSKYKKQQKLNTKRRVLEKSIFSKEARTAAKVDNPASADSAWGRWRILLPIL